MVVFRPLQHAGVTSCADDIVQKSDPALQDAVGAAFLKACSSSSLISLGRGRTVIAEHESRGWMVGRHHRRDPGGFIIRAGIYSVDISFSLDQMRGNGVEIRIWGLSDRARGQLAFGHVILRPLAMRRPDMTTRSQDDFRTVLDL